MGSIADMGASRLFTPMRAGATTTAHRIVMAPLTRLRADDSYVPLPFVKDYYTQRACVPGTLLISEATFISKRAGGMTNAPGIYSTEQIEAWKKIVSSVHAAGSKIFLQLWALGRVAKQDVATAEGFDVISSSAIKPDDSPQYVTPRALTEDEIWSWISDYATAAKNAVHVASFDGVEIHGANGYLIDQFTKDTCNQRTDQWGGSVENRSRFAFEVAKAVVEAVGADRTAIRLSPFGVFQAMDMKDPVPQFDNLIRKLSTLNLAYLHFLWRSHRDPSAKPEGQIQFALDAWKSDSPLLLCGWMTPESAVQLVDDTFIDRNIGIVFGRPFMSNPDLVFRIRNGIALKESDKDDWYRVKQERGYTDEPFSKEWVAQQNGTEKEEVVDWGRCNA